MNPSRCSPARLVQFDKLAEQCTLNNGAGFQCLFNLTFRPHSKHDNEVKQWRAHRVIGTQGYFEPVPSRLDVLTSAWLFSPWICISPGWFSSTFICTVAITWKPYRSARIAFLMEILSCCMLCLIHVDQETCVLPFRYKCPYSLVERHSLMLFSCHPQPRICLCKICKHQQRLFPSLLCVFLSIIGSISLEGLQEYPLPTPPRVAKL